MVERSGRAQASICFCGRFYGGRNVKISVWEDFYSFCDAIVINGRWAAVTIWKPVLFVSRADGDGTVDGGAVVVGWGVVVTDWRDWEVGWSDRV